MLTLSHTLFLVLPLTSPMGRPETLNQRERLTALRCSRLARRGGVKRISATVYDEVREALKSRLQMVSPDRGYAKHENALAPCSFLHHVDPGL